MAPRNVQSHGRPREGQWTRGWVDPWQSLACGSYFFFSRRSFSAWVPSLAGTMGSCRPSSESVSRTRREETACEPGPLLLPSPGQGLESRPTGGSTVFNNPGGLMRPSTLPGTSAHCPYIQAAPQQHQTSHPAQRVSPGEPQPWKHFPTRWTEVVLPVQQQSPRQNIAVLQTKVQRKPGEPDVSGPWAREGYPDPAGVQRWAHRETWPRPLSQGAHTHEPHEETFPTRSSSLKGLLNGRQTPIGVHGGATS